MNQAPPPRPWLRPLLWGLVIIAMAGATMAYVFFAL